MDEDGDLPPEDDVKPATNIESTLSKKFEGEEEGRGIGVEAGESNGSNGDTGLRKGEENERMAGGDLEEEEEYEDDDEEEHRLIMDEHGDDDDEDKDINDDDDDESVDEREYVDENDVMSQEEEVIDVNDDVPDDEDDDEEEEDEGEDEEEGDTTDGAPPQLESTTVMEQQVLLKRPHIQSKRMQEYQEMQQMTHTAGREFKCPYPTCGRIFNSAPGLRYHVKQTHQEAMESFVCPNCHREFKSLNGRKYHIKRCKVFSKGYNPTSTSTTIATITSPSSSQVSSSMSPVESSPPPSIGGPSRVPPPPLVLPPRDGCPAPRLLDLATIATGPQSPLLQGLGSARVGTSFFDSPEKNAVMALSSMAQKRSSRNSTTEEPEESSSNVTVPGSSQGSGPVSVSGSGVENDPGVTKSKRPMNGFMLYAQKHRADFTKKFPRTNNRMISTKLSEEWAKLPELERQRWKEDARQMAEVQRSKDPDCWKRKKYSSKDRN